MALDWSQAFEHFGVKEVTRTDKAKAAYVPTRSQCEAIEAAGINPRQGAEFDVSVLCDPRISTVKASYYYSERSAAAHRTPEPRVGRAFVSSWLEQGDRVLIGNIGAELFALKLAAAPSEIEAFALEVARKASAQTVFALARKAAGPAARRAVQREEFIRSPFVVEAALRRSKGKCEMPGCVRPLFDKGDGEPYLEVHHVTPLSENGEDALANAVALCPHCHREVHFGSNKARLRTALAAHVSAVEP